MINKIHLHPEANAIRNDKSTSFETKEILIDTLKKESVYTKDLELSDEKRSQHKEKQAILTKLKTEGQSPEFVDRVRKSFYPWYDESHKKYDTWVEKVSEWASEKMKTMMQSQYDSMSEDNKPYPGDLEKLQSWKELDYREEWGTKIVNIPWVGEMCIVSGVWFSDLYKQGKWSFDNLENSDNFKIFASNIKKNVEMISEDDRYQLFDAIRKQIGIVDVVDGNFIDNSVTLAEEIEDSSEWAPLSNEFARILRSCFLLFGKKDWFHILDSIDDEQLFTNECYKHNIYLRNDTFLDIKEMKNWWEIKLIAKIN